MDKTYHYKSSFNLYLRREMHGSGMLNMTNTSASLAVSMMKAGAFVAAHLAFHIETAFTVKNT